MSEGLLFIKKQVRQLTDQVFKKNINFSLFFTHTIVIFEKLDCQLSIITRKIEVIII
jgi:hypothetical protein